MTGRGYLWVLSLQFFVIDHETMTGRGSLWVLSLQILVIVPLALVRYFQNKNLLSAHSYFFALMSAKL